MRGLKWMLHGKLWVWIVSSVEYSFFEMTLNLCGDEPVAIPEREALQSGLRHGFVRISAEYGGGYLANVEALHHLHCLVCMMESVVRHCRD